METLGGALGYQFSYCQVSPSPIKSTYLLTMLRGWITKWSRLCVHANVTIDRYKRKSRSRNVL